MQCSQQLTESDIYQNNEQISTGFSMKSKQENAMHCNNRDDLL